MTFYDRLYMASSDDDFDPVIDEVASKSSEDDEDEELPRYRRHPDARVREAMGDYDECPGYWASLDDPYHAYNMDGDQIGTIRRCKCEDYPACGHV